MNLEGNYRALRESRSGGLEGVAACREGDGSVRAGQLRVRKAGGSIHLPGAGFQVGAQTADRLIIEGPNRSMHGCGLGYTSVHLIKGRVIFPISLNFILT